jgi:hypothetical protein
MNKRLIIAVGLAVSLPMVNARAEFTGYYKIDGAGPGGLVVLPPSISPVTLGNWKVKSDGVRVVEFQRSPVTESILAKGWTLTVDSKAGAAGNASFEIFAPPVGANADAKNTFTWNFGLPLSGNSAYWRDTTGTHPIVGQGSGVFNVPLGSLGEYGFYVVGGGSLPAVLQLQDWVPEPSAIAMGLITCLGTVGFVVRRYRSGKS